MDQESAARILLVRAVEEVLPQRIPPEGLLEAHLAAGDPAEGEPWIARRAAYLLEHSVRGHAAVLPSLDAIRSAPGVVFLAGVLVGLVSNYLGPSAKIHVLWNPIVVLIAWNIVVYAGLAGAAVVRGVRDDAPITADAAPARPRTRRTPSTRRQGFFERRVFGPLVAWLLGVRQTAARAREQADDATAVARRFAVLWWPLMRPALHRTLRYTLHLGAIGLAAGAVCGMYVRGLFLAYDVVWQSTFLKDPEVVATCLRALLGPAALVLGSEVPDSAAEMDALMGEGAPAAPWIHLYAMSAVLFIVLPRTLLAMAARHRLRRTERFFRLDLSEEYYADLLRRAHAVAPQELRAGIQQVARDECRKVAAGLADLVTSRLYDERIVPRLRRFRETGGTLRALEAELAQECRAFGPVLEREMLHLQRDLEGRLVARVRRLLGDDHGLAARVPGDLVDRVTVASSRAATHVGERVSGDVAAAVGGVVSGAVGLAVGTISGGFGEALGIALLVGVVETGPVGWLVGAVGGIVVAGVALVAGRERLRQGVKVVPLPAAALKVALWSGRYERLVEEGRRKCRQSVADALAGQLDELAARIADHVWRGLRPLIGELQRPRVGDDLQRPSADRDDGGS